uniref:Uncharacterized protein n=1 Tax=Anguilla anguilla TaxID=7936 RepID=A0A0E9S8I4_ANGAN
MHIRDSQTHCTYVYLWAVLCSYAVDTQHDKNTKMYK